MALGRNPALALLRIQELSRTLHGAVDETHEAIAQARAAGCSWEQIARALGHELRLPHGRSSTAVRSYFAARIARGPLSGPSEPAPR